MAINYEILSIDREAGTTKVNFINPRLSDKHKNLERDVVLPRVIDGEDYNVTLNSRIEAVALGVEVKMGLLLDETIGKKAKPFNKILDSLGVPDYVPPVSIAAPTSEETIEVDPEISEPELLVETKETPEI